MPHVLSPSEVPPYMEAPSESTAVPSRAEPATADACSVPKDLMENKVICSTVEGHGVRPLGDTQVHHARGHGKHQHACGAPLPIAECREISAWGSILLYRSHIGTGCVLTKAVPRGGL